MLLQSAELIGWALGGLEREIVETRKRLTSLTEQAAHLRTRLTRKGRAAGPIVAPNAAAAAEPPARRRRRRMSAEARKRISDMMKKRWAERKKRG